VDGASQVTVELVDEKLAMWNNNYFAVGNIVDFFDGTSEEVDFTIENSDPVSITELTASSEIVVLPDATVDFSIVSDGATDFLWDFGDGNTSTDENPSYTFSESGTYTVTCTASNDNCLETSTLTIEVGTTVSIRDLNDAFVIYPNPAQEILNVNLGNSRQAEQISLIDLSGRTVAEVSHSDQISVSHLANGTYFVRVMSEGKQWMKKIQVIR
jgi:PKD repeat protein